MKWDIIEIWSSSIAYLPEMHQYKNMGIHWIGKVVPITMET